MALNSQERASSTTEVRGLSISISFDLIGRVTTVPLRIPWIREDKTSSTISKNNFLTANEKPIEDKNGVERESLPYPWDEVAYHILKFISCEGRLILVYGYQFTLLHELIFQVELSLAQRLSVTYFLLQSILDLSQKVR